MQPLEQLEWSKSHCNIKEIYNSCTMLLYIVGFSLLLELDKIWLANCNLVKDKRNLPCFTKLNKNNQTKTFQSI